MASRVSSRVHGPPRYRRLHRRGKDGLRSTGERGPRAYGRRGPDRARRRRREDRLVDEEIFERKAYSDHPTRYDYRLTRKGDDLFTAMNALRQWGDRDLCTKPMRLLRVKDSGKPVVAVLVPEGTPALTNDEVELVPGPGFPQG